MKFARRLSLLLNVDLNFRLLLRTAKNWVWGGGWVHPMGLEILILTMYLVEITLCALGQSSALLGLRFCLSIVMESWVWRSEDHLTTEPSVFWERWIHV